MNAPADFPAPLLVAFAGSGAVATALLAWLLWRVLRTGERVEMAITGLVAAIATAGAISGMWKVFTQALELPPAWAAVVCGVLELAMLAEALRARRNLIKHGTVGVDGGAVWVFAATSAVLSAAEEHGTVARTVRLALPLVAAWLWERSLAATRRDVAGPRVAVAWRFTPRRVAVWLRLADPTERDATDIDRARRLARMTRQRWRVDALETASVPRWVAIATARRTRLAVARWRWDRQRLAAITHLGLGQEARAVAAIRDVMEAARRLDTATAPAALEQRSATAPRPVRQASATSSAQVADGTAIVRPPVAAPVAPLAVHAAAPMSATSSEVADMAVGGRGGGVVRPPRGPPPGPDGG